MPLQRPHLPLHGQLHHLADAIEQAVAGVGGEHLRALPPLLHAGREHERYRVVDALAEAAVQLRQRRAGPEGPLEDGGVALEADDPPDLVEDHGPDPERRHHQQQHDELDDDVGFEGQRQNARAVRRIAERGRADRLGIHCCNRAELSVALVAGRGGPAGPVEGGRAEGVTSGMRHGLAGRIDR